MEIIAWIGFSQGLFAAILMISKKNRTIPDKILSAWLSLLAIEFFSCAIDYWLFGYPLLSSSFLLFNPAFYLYLRSLVQPDFRLKALQLAHLLPFLFFEIFAYILHEPYMLFGYLELNPTYWFRLIFAIASLASWVAYNFTAGMIIYRHRSRLVDEFSNIESNKKISWLFFVIVFYNLYCLILLVSGIFNVFMYIEFPISTVINYSALLVLVYVLGFYGLKQEVIFSELNGNSKNDEKNSNPMLSEEHIRIIKANLIDYFDKTEPYLNPDLSMDMLSKALGFPKHHITEVLNKEIGKNFFQFVNEHRVEAVKDMLSANKNYFSIEAIGYECGFNSKSSFFTIFKKATGQTPLQFKNSNL